MLMQTVGKKVDIFWYDRRLARGKRGAGWTWRAAMRFVLYIIKKIRIIICFYYLLKKTLTTFIL